MKKKLLEEVIEGWFYRTDLKIDKLADGSDWKKLVKEESKELAAAILKELL